MFPFHSKDWYKGVLTDQELEELENPKPKVRDPAASAARRGTKGTRPKPKSSKPREEVAVDNQEQ